MKKEMLINVLQPEECRIAIVEDGVLEELYVERSSQESYVGNIYKGRIVNIEPSIQAAFVDFGIGRNGFLHVSDVDPAYFKHLLSKDDLAAYEAEHDREYGSRGSSSGSGRDRDRGSRTPQPMTSWLKPQPAPAEDSTASDAILATTEEFDDFSAGLDEEMPIAEEMPVAEEALSPEDEVVEIVEGHVEEMTSSTEGDVDPEFIEGLLEAHPHVTPISTPEATPMRAAPIPPPVARVPRVEPPRVKPAEASDDDDFGAGIVDEAKGVETAPSSESDFGAGVVDEAVAAETVPTPEPHVVVKPTTTREPRAPEAVAGSALSVTNPPEPVESGEAGEPADGGETADGGEPKTRKPRGRKGKPKADELPAEEASEPPAEGKGKPKSRRPRKKADGEGDAASEGDAPEDKPKFMGGAERRTSPNDDEEPEITPFFEDSGGFDPDAPNDRFADSASDVGTQPRDEEVGGFTTDPETVEEAESEAREIAYEEELLPVESEEQPTTVGRGFNDDFDSGPPRRDRDRGRGRDRDRDRDRGGRDRDRGSRGDRGSRPGGFKGPKSGRDRGLPKPKIEEIFKRGQEVLVQVIKDAVGTKAPTLSTYISIAGRYLVLMPSLDRVGVSRKIEDHDARKRLREIMNTLSPPKGVGFIVRTAAVDRDAKELRNDLASLLRLWQVVVKRIKRVAGPVEIYRESDMITRTIRDIFTNDVETIWVDEQIAFSHAQEFLQIVMPKFAGRIRHFESSEPLFHKYGVEDEIAKIHQKRIEMPLGGSLVIEQTEALVAIDVNSGNFRADNNAEETAFQMNLHAAKEIARQLRLRDLGGVIVNDFIDMRSETHRRKVEDALRDALKRDRARTKILRISQFGLIEMTRQRIRPSLKRSIFSDCPHCRGSGFVKTSESLSIDAMRLLQLAAHRTPAISTVQLGVHPDVAHYLLNKRRKELAGLEERGKMEILVTAQPGVSPDTIALRCYDHNGNEVRLLPPPPLPRIAGGGRFSGGRGERDRGERERRYPQPLD